MQPARPGVVGELYIGGAGVARGYLNRPELTGERFLADPFSGESGARLYKTGDRGRYRDDGTLECLGRVDGQVKVRGYRIELGEIEATLAGHLGVQACVVLAREDTPGNKQLAGYIIARQGESLAAEELQIFLRKKLPEYMVPAHLLFVDSFPLTQNGKIDRKALQAMPYRNICASQEFVAPGNAIENKIAAIWMELLKVERIGIHDNFFELGGDSLQAVKAMLRIQEVFGVVPSLQTFIPRPTIAALARSIISSEGTRDCLAYVVPVQPNGKDTPIFWIGGGQMTQLSEYLGSNQPFFGLGFEPRIIDRVNLPYRIEEIANHLLLALREEQPSGPYRLGGFCQDGVFAFEVARQLAEQGQDVELLALFEAANPSPEVRVRIPSEIRRLVIRMAFQLNQAFRLRIGDLPSYLRGRRGQLHWRILRMSWRISTLLQSFGFKYKPDFRQVLFQAVCSYKPKPVACPTIIIRCKDWPTISAGDPYFGWQSMLVGHCETYEVSGDHMGIFSEANGKILADRLKIFLQKRPFSRETISMELRT
jgi:thioesterase domain-containing protein/acyl carrier protein